MGAEVLSSRAVQGKFYETLAEKAGQGWVEPISMYVPSDQESEVYKWLGMSPAMREWIGGRNPKALRDNGLTIVNKHYEASLRIREEDFRRDKTGQVLIRAAELADRTNAHWPSLLSTLIINGASTVCYDGDYFFGDAHAEGDSGTQDNNINSDVSELATGVHGTKYVPSVGEMSLSILAGIAQILGFKDDQGEPFNDLAQSFVVMAPQSLMASVFGAVSNQFLAAGESNPLIAGGFKVTAVVNPRLSTWTDKFVIFRTDGRAKPFIRQEEKAVELEVIAEGSEHAKLNKEFLFMVDTWRNAGYGLWQHSCLVTMI
jgi:phage major head subunit gpT-like protein